MVFGYLSMSGGFLKLNASLPPILAVSAVAIKYYVTSPMSDTVLAFLGVPAAKVPALVGVSISLLAFFVQFPVIMGLAATKGYDNSMPRVFKASDSLKEYPVMFRLQSAHNNTLEFLAMMAPCFWSASTIGLDQLLFAKLSSLILLCRVIYAVAYALDSNLIRTTIFMVGFNAMACIGLAPIFPDTILPLLK